MAANGQLEVFHYGEGRPRQIGWQLIEDSASYDPEPSFSQPALIFHGTNDTVVPPRIGGVRRPASERELFPAGFRPSVDRFHGFDLERNASVSRARTE